MRGTCQREKEGMGKEQKVKDGWKKGERLTRRGKGHRERGMMDRERGDLLWIVVCHIHPPTCSYTRVLLLSLNRC